MGTPHELTGTAVARPNDPDSQMRAWELANTRLHHSAEVLGVFIGTPRFETIHARGRDTGHQLIILTAPVLDTGTDEKIDTATAVDDSPADTAG